MHYRRSQRNLRPCRLLAAYLPSPLTYRPVHVLAVRPCALGASLLLAACAGGAVAQPAYEAEGVVVDESTRAIHRFRLDEHGDVTLQFFGTSDVTPRLGQEASFPDTAIDSLTLSAQQLLLISERVAETLADDPPEREFGFHLEPQRLRLQFDQGLPIWFALLIAAGLLLVGGAGAGVWLTHREQRRKREEAAARQRALHAREAERTRIARDIHDGPLQDVHALRLLAGVQNEALSDEASRIARELRAIAEGLRPPALGRFGLAAALSAHANRVKEQHPGVAVRLDLDEDGTGPDALPDIARSALFRIAQESITNAIEHGGATCVEVRLSLPTASGGTLELDILDDGSGFPWASAAPDLAALADDGHFGLVGMHERAAAIGGTLALRPDGLQGAGGRVRVSLPDPRKADRQSARPRPLLPTHA